MPLDLTHAVSRHDDRALHRQLADAIRTAITTGRCAPGEALPSEGTIAAGTGTSRTVVRDALNLLVTEGLVVKRSGSPTRVAMPAPRRHMTTRRYAEELALLRAGGPHPLRSAFTAEHGAEWADYTIDATYVATTATIADAERLAVPAKSDVLRRRLVKYIAGAPAQIQDSVIPLALVDGTSVMDPGRQPWPGGTIAELYSVGLVVTRVVEEAAARLPTAVERRTLEMPPGPVWEIMRTFHVGDRPAEVSRVVCSAASVRLCYETELGAAGDGVGDGALNDTC